MVVGREPELAAIERFLDGDTALLLEGEPGIGKTALLRAGLAAAESRGWRVFRAQPTEHESQLSYATLADLVAVAYDEVESSVPKPQRLALDAALLRIEGSADARTVGTAFVSVLSALAERTPVLVAIDDCQWIDRASRRVLEYAARRLPTSVRLLLAQRSGASTAVVLTTTRVELGPLSLGALHQMLQDSLGDAPTRPLLVRIAETSGGNPFYALEIARSLRSNHDTGAQLPLPASLRQLVADRIDALSPQARDAALVAATLSRPTIAGIGSGTAALDEAEAAGVLVVDVDRIRFTHPLLASAVYASARGAERVELHRRLADLADDPEERALHLALSSTAPDEVTAGELESAAARAARRGAQDAAADLYRAAARLTPSEHADGRARRLVGEAAALHAAGSPAEARSIAEQAAESAVTGQTRAEALVQLSQIAWVDRGDLGPLDYLRLALDEAGDDRRLRGRIHAKLGMYSDGDQAAGLVHARAAAELIDEDDDPGLLAYTLLTLLFFGAQTGHGADERLLERALELERRAGPDSERSSLALIWYQATDAHDAARARHALEDAWYRDRGEEIWRAEKRAHLALVEFRAGNWELARALIEQSCADLEPIGSEGPLAMPFWTRAHFDAHTGQIERSRGAILPMLEEARQGAGSPWFTTFLLETVGFAALTEGDYAGADRAFTEMELLFETLGVTVPLAVRAEADHVEAVVASGDLERATQLLSRFERRAASAPRPWVAQELPRARSLLLAATGDVGGALAVLEAAPAIETLPFGYARNLLSRGTLRRRLKQRRAAAEDLQHALDLFERLGSPDWARHARDELGRVGLRRGDPSALTETERRVAELTASGLTNREVAQAAFISPKTVESNLARVYRKLGIKSRAELGAAMANRPGTQT